MPPTPETCPHCGAELRPKAKFCSQCGADHTTGWSEEAGIQGLDLPDDAFDYDSFVESELGGGQKIRPRGISWFWWLIAFALVAGFIVMMLWH